MHFLVKWCKARVEWTSSLGEIGLSMPRRSGESGAGLGRTTNTTISMVQYMVMTKVNVAEVKERLSSYLDRVQQGETVIICRRNVPIAELRPIAHAPRVQRPIGIDRGMKVPDSFFEPLPEVVIEAFEPSYETE